MPESSKKRGFLEGAVIHFTYYLNGMDYRNSDDLRRGILNRKPRRTRYVPGLLCVAQTSGGREGSRDADGDMGSAP
jgi:hypothetical protein